MAKSRLSLQVIDPEKARVIRLQADLVRDEGFFLAGAVIEEPHQRRLLVDSVADGIGHW